MISVLAALSLLQLQPVLLAHGLQLPLLRRLNLPSLSLHRLLRPLPLSKHLTVRNVERILIFIEHQELVGGAIFAPGDHAFDLGLGVFGPRRVQLLELVFEDDCLRDGLVQVGLQIVDLFLAF